MKIWIVLVIVVIVLLFLIAYIAYRKVFCRSKNIYIDPYDLPIVYKFLPCKDRILELIREMEENPYQEVYIRAKDGVSLFAKYYHVDDDAPLHIQMHGYKGNGGSDFAAGNKVAREAGHNTLVVDQRAHGWSEGRTISFGVKEKHDCICWAQYALKRFGANKPVILYGMSMGAATVLLASAEELPPNVVGVIADSPYSTAKEVICRVCKDMKLPPNVVYPFIRMGGKLFGGFDPSEANVIEAVSRAKVPILLIHGEADTMVPQEMSEKLYAANPKGITRATFPGAAHGVSFYSEEERYTKLCKEFIEAVSRH